ncbi:MAG: sigma factor, partial [Rikenellaceae bacterium]
MDVQPLSDNLLLSRYLSGDKSAISQLIERHTPRVRSYLRMMTKDVDLADDIFQETFIKAVRMIDSGRYTDNGRFLSWV